jgi:hypothetical protein
MTTRRIAGSAVALGISLLACVAGAAAGEPGATQVPLSRDRDAVCRIVVLDAAMTSSDVGTSLALDKAAAELQAVVQRSAGVRLTAEHKPSRSGVAHAKRRPQDRVHRSAYRIAALSSGFAPKSLFQNCKSMARQLLA